MITNKKICSAKISLLFAAIAFPGAVFAEPPEVKAKAEEISNHIHRADLNRELRDLKAEVARHGLQGTESKGHKAPPVPSVKGHQRVHPGRKGELFHAESDDGITVAIPAAGVGPVEIATPGTDAPKLKVGLPERHSHVEGVTADDGTVVYTDSEELTDVAVQPFEDSVRILTILKGEDSPSEYTYNVTLPEGGKISEAENGGILITDAEGSLVGGFAAPWAVDSAGKDIPTWYEIRDEAVVQVVNHLETDAEYPIVADPWLFKNLISSASWSSSSEGWTLKVAPTTWARLHAGGYAVGVAGWNELYGRYKNVGRGIKRNLGGMKDQWICHQQVVAIRSPRKATWNLDEYRKDVSYLATVNAQCNPGGRNIFD